jgi:hypothetical protein
MLPMTILSVSAEFLVHRQLEHSTSFQQAGFGQDAMADPRIAAAALFTAIIASLWRWHIANTAWGISVFPRFESNP